MYKGNAEYDTIQRTREAVQIPLIANGDITSIQKAREVLSATGADAVMIGRGTQATHGCRGSSPLNSTVDSSRPPVDAQIATMAKLIREIQLFYGENTGVKIARKHMQWFLKRFANGLEAWSHLHHLVDPDEQYQRFIELIDGGGLRDGTERTG